MNKINLFNRAYYARCIVTIKLIANVNLPDTFRGRNILLLLLLLCCTPIGLRLIIIQLLSIINYYYYPCMIFLSYKVPKKKYRTLCFYAEGAQIN